jgi:hypothetical protein
MTNGGDENPKTPGIEVLERAMAIASRSLAESDPAAKTVEGILRALRDELRHESHASAKATFLDAHLPQIRVLIAATLTHG